jgi:hypothetical protein
MVCCLPSAVTQRFAHQGPDGWSKRQTLGLCLNPGSPRLIGASSFKQRQNPLKMPISPVGAHLSRRCKRFNGALCVTDLSLYRTQAKQRPSVVRKLLEGFFVGTPGSLWVPVSQAVLITKLALLTSVRQHLEPAEQILALAVSTP